MKKRLPGLRIAMRIGRRKARAAGEKDIVDALTMALADRDIQMEVLSRLDSMYGQQMTAQEIGDGSLLDWFIENWEEILKIILAIIGMFG